MKYCLAGLLFLISATSIAQNVIVFDSTQYIIGIVPEGPDGKYEIHFKNTGKEPVRVNRASTSDGGTYCQFDKEPIEPGEIGTIIFLFSTRGRAGNGIKAIYVRFNNDEIHNINMKWQVRPAHTLSVPTR